MTGVDELEHGRCVIIGAGPAGLTAAYELALMSVDSVVLEQDDVVGGLARTVEHHGYRFDIGGHRFFTRVPLISAWWEQMLGDDFQTCSRLSRIYYNGKFFDYPLRPLNALRGLGPIETLRIVASYAKARLLPHPKEHTFEAWVCNRFGSRLFEIFFKTYTEKVWGMKCSEIAADWDTPRRGAKLEAVYPHLPKISIDFAVMEKAPRVLVLEMDCKWVDLGSWAALEGVIDADADGNVIAAPRTVTLNARNNVLVSEDDHLIAAFGVEDLVVIHSADATLVCRKQDAQALKELVTKVTDRYEGCYR